MEISPDFSTLSLVMAAPLVLYLAFVSPLLGRRSYARLARRRDHDPRAYVRTNRLWIGELWALTAAVALIVAFSPGVGLADLGLALATDLETTAGMLFGAAVALLVTALLLRRLVGIGQPVPGQSAYQELLPRTPIERRYAAALAVSAGVCEEIVFRGFLIALGVGALGLDPAVAAGAALLVFVAGHLYQGWKGMLAVTLAGVGLTSAYFLTGSLLVPMVVHALMDLRSLLLVPAPTPARPRPAPLARDAG